jgi:16S rRNA processing protein RimM
MCTVAKVRDAHGLKGELFIIPFSKTADWAGDLKNFVLVKGEKDKEGKVVNKNLDVTIKRMKKHKVGFIVQLDQISDRTLAESYKGARIQISNENLVSKKGENIFLKEVENFLVLDAENEIGPVVGFSSNGAQDLLVVQSGENTQVEVPFIPEFISVIDWDKKQIKMTLPEGFLQELVREV